MSDTSTARPRTDPRDIKPQTFNLKTPLLSGGMTRSLLVDGENSNMHILCYASGLGENHGIHAHPDEEHSFIVLSGSAQFNTLAAGKLLLRKHEGIFLPKGCFYEFINPEAGPLVILRFGASVSSGLLEGQRLDPQGRPFPSPRGHLVPTPIPDAFFE